MKLSKDLQTKLGRFRRDKRALFSFYALAALFLLSLPAELICNIRPYLIVVDSKPYSPILFTYSEKDFGGTLQIEPDYHSAYFLSLLTGEEPRDPDSISANDFDGEDSEFSLDLGDFEESAPAIPEFTVELEDFENSDAALSATHKKSTDDTESKPAAPRDVFMLWPPIRYDYKVIPSTSTTGVIALAAPYERKTPDGQGVIASSWQDGHYLGTDDRGRDVLARFLYGFRISMFFGLSLAITGTILGCLIGGTQGFFGGWVDLIGQRFTEMWGSMPRLYILIILSAFLTPSALILFFILNLTAWMGIAAYTRAEFLKIRNLEFVKAARAMGVSNFGIMRRHILPNALTPVITFFPFEVTAGILALVSLDYLNLGVPSPAPSMGELLAQGKNNLQALWILIPTFALLTTALTLLTFFGEGIRNAFDPRKSA